MSLSLEDRTDQARKAGPRLAKLVKATSVYNPIKAKEHYEELLKKGPKSAPWVMLELAKLHASGQISENGLTHARKWIYQIISQSMGEVFVLVGMADENLPKITLT